MNLQKIREDNLIKEFCELQKKKFKFQDQDILNLTCKDAHIQIPMKYNMTDYSFIFLNEEHPYYNRFSEQEIEEAVNKGNIHYNGHKPWIKYSINFDIWWEYYRKSPYFNRKVYHDFFYCRLNIFDQLSLWKRIKILARYFVYGKRII